MPQLKLEKRCGLTRPEVAVVIAIIVVVGALLAPFLVKAHIAHQRARCQDNLRLIVNAAHNAHDGFGYIPSNPDTIEKTTGTLFLFLLNFTEDKPIVYQKNVDSQNKPVGDGAWRPAPSHAVYQKYVDSQNKPGKQAEYAAAVGSTIKLYVCPADPSSTSGQYTRDGTFGTEAKSRIDALPNPNGNPPYYGPSSYCSNNLLFNTRVRLPGSIPAGTSNTIMFAEKFQATSYWAYYGQDTRLVVKHADRDCNQAPKPGIPTDPQPFYVASSTASPLSAAYGFDQMPSPFPRVQWPSTAHPDGIQVGMADGRVITLNKSISPRTWYAANDPCTKLIGDNNVADWGS